jgi:hypothetical protein
MVDIWSFVRQPLFEQFQSPVRQAAGDLVRGKWLFDWIRNHPNPLEDVLATPRPCTGKRNYDLATRAPEPLRQAQHKRFCSAYRFLNAPTETVNYLHVPYRVNSGLPRLREPHTESMRLSRTNRTVGGPAQSVPASSLRSPQFDRTVLMCEGHRHGTRSKRKLCSSTDNDG